MRKYLLYILPFFASLFTGWIIFVSSLGFQNNDIKNLLINIASALLVIPIIFLSYDLINKFTKAKLRKEMFDYAKMIVDRNILSTLFQLLGIVYPLSTPKTRDQINRFLAIKGSELENLITKENKVGFQVLKNFDFNEAELHEILKNPYILNILDDAQIISLIKILKGLSYLQSLIGSYGLFIPNNERETGLKVISAKKLGGENGNFPNRFLLLKPISNKTYHVVSFGDFKGYTENELLEYYTINVRLKDSYKEAITDLLKEVNCWLNVTGKEFIVDTRIFRIREMVAEGWTRDMVEKLS